MRWKKVEYPFSWNYNDKDYMPKAEENFWKFIHNAGITKMDIFNFGYDIEKLFWGENPRYNPRLLDTCVIPDHTRNIYYAPGRETFIVGFPYNNYNFTDTEINNLQQFCDKYNTCCVVLPERYSFYRNRNTVMVIFSHKNALDNLIELYGVDKDRLYFLEPKINFYDYITSNYLEAKNPIGDLARDMKNDKKIPEDKNNDRNIFDHIYWISRGDSDVEKTVKKAQNLYSDYKRNLYNNKYEF